MSADSRCCVRLTCMLEAVARTHDFLFSLVAMSLFPAPLNVSVSKTALGGSVYVCLSGCLCCGGIRCVCSRMVDREEAITSDVTLSRILDPYVVAVVAICWGAPHRGHH